MTSAEREETIKIAMEVYRKEHQEKVAKKKKETLALCKILLENYRTLGELAADEAETADDFYAIVEKMGLETESLQDIATEFSNVKKSSKAVAEHMKKALDSYFRQCKCSKMEENMRKYRTIKSRYFDETMLDVNEIATKEAVDVSTVYKDLRDGTQAMAIRILGIGAIL